MTTPGKLNTGQWEQTSSPSAPAPSGSKGKAALFEQAARDAAPKEVQKKVCNAHFHQVLDFTATRTY
jgi:hypothetical protein